MWFIFSKKCKRIQINVNVYNNAMGEYDAKRAGLSRSKESGEKNSAEEFLFISSRKAVRRGEISDAKEKGREESVSLALAGGSFPMGKKGR